jgi:hypothetical protein
LRGIGALSGGVGLAQLLHEVGAATRPTPRPPPRGA